MKILILLLLIACGHQSPPQQDLNDSDGDKIVNQDELSSKYLADVKKLDLVKGIGYIRSGNLNGKKFTFSNDTNLTRRSFELLTRNLKAITEDEFYAEWAHLVVKKDFAAITSAPTEWIRLELKFEEFSHTPKDLFVIENGKRTKLAAWSKSVDLTLESKIFDSILSGKATLALEMPDQQLEIKEKTYRVYLHEGGVSQIFYVSKELSFAAFMDSKEIFEARDLSLIDPFTAHQKADGWWVRQVQNDYILVNGSGQKVREEYLNGFSKTSHILERVNGAAAAIRINKHPDAKIFAVTRPSRILRNFSNEIESDTYTQQMHQDRLVWTCDYTYRRTNSFSFVVTDVDTGQLIVGFEGHKLNLLQNAQFVELFTGADQTFEFGLSIEAAEVSLSLPALPLSSFDKTGIVHHKCRGDKTTPGRVLSVAATHPEERLRFEMDVYVEQLDNDIIKP